MIVLLLSSSAMADLGATSDFLRLRARYVMVQAGTPVKGYEMLKANLKPALTRGNAHSILLVMADHVSSTEHDGTKSHSLHKMRHTWKLSRR